MSLWTAAATGSSLEALSGFDFSTGDPLDLHLGTCGKVELFQGQPAFGPCPCTKLKVLWRCGTEGLCGQRTLHCTHSFMCVV